MNKIETWKIHDSQRGYFAFELYKAMAENNDIVLITMDLGFGMFDNHFEDMPEQCINTGASEQAGMGVAVGLALQGKTVFVYTISSFFMRAAETINIYVHNEQIPIKLVGSGVDDSYKHDGYSHNATMVEKLMGLFNIKTYLPDSKEQVVKDFEKMLKSKKPSCILLQR